MKRPWYQKLAIGAGSLIGGLLILGAVLDAVSNAKTLVTPAVTYVSTALVVGLFLALQLRLRKNPLSWVVRGGREIRVSRLGLQPILFVLGILLLLWIPRFMEDRNVAQKESNTPPSQKDKRQIGNLIVILFDPTILRDDPPAFAQLLEEFRAAFLSIPEMSTVVLFVVDRGSRNRHPAHVEYLPKVGGEFSQIRGVERSYSHVAAIMQATWNSTRSSDAIGRSCLLSSLYSAAEYLGSLSGRRTQPRKHLLIISDMVEVCSDRGLDTNLSWDGQNFSRASEFRLPPVDLSGFDNIIVNRVPYPGLTSPSQVVALDALWRATFRDFKARPDALFSTVLPRPLPWEDGVQ